MRRAKLQPRTIHPVPSRSPPEDAELKDVRIPTRQATLPPIGNDKALPPVAPPAGKPERSPTRHRRVRPKTGAHNRQSQTKKSPDLPAAPTPAPRDRDESYVSFKEFVTGASSNTQQHIKYHKKRSPDSAVSPPEPYLSYTEFVTGAHYKQQNVENYPKRASHIPANQTPNQWGREEPYFSYKDFVGRAPSNTQQNVFNNLPDVHDRKGQVSRCHLRVRAPNKDLKIINEIVNEPARRAAEPLRSSEVTSHNRCTSRNMSYLSRNKTPSGDPSTENVNKDKTRIQTASGSHAPLPPLEKLLKKRGNMRKNTLYD